MGSTSKRKQIHKKTLKARKYTIQGREFRAGPETRFQRLSRLCGHRLAEQRAWGRLIAPSDRKSGGQEGASSTGDTRKCGPGETATESRQESSANPQAGAPSLDHQGWREQGDGENQRGALAVPSPGGAELQLLMDDRHPGCGSSRPRGGAHPGAAC